MSDNESSTAYANPTKLNEAYEKLVPEGSEEMGFFEYLEYAQNENPKVLRNSFQYLADAIESFGVEKRDDSEFNEYKLFTEDPVHNGEYKLVGREIRRATGELVSKVKSGARGLDTGKRIFVSAGGVGTGKSLTDFLIRRGLEHYTQGKGGEHAEEHEGEMYTYKLVDLYEALDDQDPADDEIFSPMAKNPITLLPEELRQPITDRANNTLQEQDPEYEYTLDNRQTRDPVSEFLMDELLEAYDQNLGKVLENHVEVVRYEIDESKMQGIGLFEPKDKKNQDETELTGDKNFSKIPIYGDSDPRSLDMYGAFCVANRGIFSGEELLKAQEEFLYDFLHAAEERTIKPTEKQRTSIDQVIFGRTNMPEYIKQKNNETMEAFQDRTELIKFQYNMEYEAEAEIYRNKIEHADTESFHIEPHTLDMVGLMAVLTRLEEDENIHPIEKAKIYNGEETEASVDYEELRKEANKKADHDLEGMEGVSPRFFTNRIDAAIEKVAVEGGSSVNALTVLKEIENNMRDHGSIREEELEKYDLYLEGVEEEYKKERLIPDVRHALAFDKEELEKVGGKYLDHALAYNRDETVEDEVTGEPIEPDKEFMKEIEQHANIKGDPDTFRRTIADFTASYAVEHGENPDIEENQRLMKAVEKKLWEDKKKNINLSALVSATEDDTEDSIDQDWIETLKTKGYSREGAIDALEQAAGIIAEEDLGEELSS